MARVPPEKITRAQAMRAEGASCVEIGLALGVSKATASMYARGNPKLEGPRRAAIAAAQGRQRQRWEAAGLCPNCGKRPPASGLKNCRECIDAARQRSKTPGASARRIARRARDRALVLAAYGGACVCCGENTPEFLTLDHVDRDGAAHKRELGGKKGSSDLIYRWAIREGFPASLQLLCFNCNCGRERNGGVCPHECHLRAVV